jgi:MscS family membrane protein
MRTGDEVIKRGLAAGLMLALVGMAGWPGTAAAEPVRSKPTLKEALETRAQVVAPAAVAGAPEDEFDRGTPKTAVIGFLQATRELNYERAARYLDLPDELRERGPELARQLRIVLGRQLWIDLEALSTSPDGDENDGLVHARDRVGRIAGGEKSYDIMLQRVPREDGVYIWKFARSTVAEIPRLSAEFGYGHLETMLPPWFFDYRIMGIEVVLWVAVTILSIVVFPIAMFLTSGLVWFLRRVDSHLAPLVERHFTGPVRMLLWVLLVRSFMQLSFRSVVAEAVFQAHTLVFVALAWMVLRLVEFLAQRGADRLETTGLAGAKVFIRPVARLVKFVAIVGSLMLWLENMGYEVTTLLAGASIGGVGVALASQKSLENVFGALTLYTAQPVRVGEFCRFGDQLGTVEEIGLRATLIRTLDRSIISVPNAEFAYMHLDNLSRRDRFWYHPRLKLRPETTPDQIRYVLVEVRKMLYAHPKVLSDPLWVRFTEISEMSRDLDVFAYIGVTDWFESLEVAEDLNLRIMDIVAEAGTELAVPSQIQYGNPAKEIDQDRARTAESKVKEWRSQQALYLPNFPPEKITELKGSLDYPPTGSPEALKHRSGVSQP